MWTQLSNSKGISNKNFLTIKIETDELVLKCKRYQILESPLRNKAIFWFRRIKPFLFCFFLLDSNEHKISSQYNLAVLILNVQPFLTLSLLISTSNHTGNSKIKLQKRVVITSRWVKLSSQQWYKTSHGAAK